MFKNDYQGGPYFEIYSVQGNQPFSKLRVSGPETIKKKFDKELRTFILILEGDSTTKVTLPKNCKQSLHLIQQYLVFQIFIFPGLPFALEVSITDKSNLKRRIILSSSHREVIVNSLHAKMPCAIIKPNVWLNLCLDLDGLVESVFHGSSMHMIDSTAVSANCKLKRIFTLKANPRNKFDIPQNMQLRGEYTTTQVIDMDSFVDAGINIRSCNSATRRNHSDSLAPIDSCTSTDRMTARHKDLHSPRSLGGTVARSGRKNIKNNLSCCGTAIAVNSRTKSADCSKSKINLDINANAQYVSKSADVRKRKIYPNVHTSRCLSKTLPEASKNLIQPIIRSRNKHSKSTTELQDVGHEKTLMFKSQSLAVLPGIGQTNVEITGPGSTVCTTSICEATDNTERNYTTFADDKMLDDYLQRELTTELGESCSSSGFSSLATSNTSDLFSFISRPHSVSDPMSIKNEVLTNITKDITAKKSLDSNCFKTSDKDSGLEVSYEAPMFKSIEHVTMNNINNSTLKKTPNDVTMNNINHITLKKTPNDVTMNNINHITLKNTPNDVTMNNINHITLKKTPNETFDKDGPSEISIEAASITSTADESFSFASDSLNTSTNDYSNKDILEKNDSIYSCVSDNQETSITEDADDYDKTNFNEPEKNKLSFVITDTDREEDSKKYDGVNALEHFRTDNNDNVDNSKLARLSDEKFTVKESFESDTMSWLNTSVDQSLCLSNNHVAQKTSQYSPHLALTKHIADKLGSFINQSIDDVDDGFSDSSGDDAPACIHSKFKKYRYQDEIKSINSTLDLSRSIPATPDTQNRPIRDENNNHCGPLIDQRFSRNEELLDLLFDPVLNCYYDPKTQKYYELS